MNKFAEEIKNNIKNNSLSSKEIVEKMENFGSL
jgi:hypothetical protein